MKRIGVARVALGGLLLAVSGLVVPLAASADTVVRTVSFDYDTAGLLKTETVEPAVPNDCLQTTHTPDSYGNRSSTIKASCAGATGWVPSTPRGVTVTYGAFTVTVGGATFNVLAGTFPTQVKNALGHTETKTFDPRFGTELSLTGPNALTTQWQSDSFGRKTRETRSDGTYTTWQYLRCVDTGANCPGSIGGALATSVVIEQAYNVNATVAAPEKRQYSDGLDRVIRTQTYGFDQGKSATKTLVQDTHYNAQGQVLKKSNVYDVNGGTARWTEFLYDAMGRVSEEWAPEISTNGAVAKTKFAYDGLNTTVTNAKNQTKKTTKNAQGLVAEVTDAVGNKVNYSYDAVGNLTQTNAAGSITTLGYNKRGMKTSMIDPAMGSWAYDYNAFGELRWQSDSLSKTTTLTYDVLGRMTNRSEPDLISNWSFDSCTKGVGKLCVASTTNGYSRTLSYDSQGRVWQLASVGMTGLAPAYMSVAYDSNTGRVASRTWPTGTSATYTYTATGFLKQVSAAGASFVVTDMNAKGQVTEFTQGGVLTTVRNYEDETGRMSSQTVTQNGQALGNMLNQSYQYDSLSNLTRRTETTYAPYATDEAFGYDSLNRLFNYTATGPMVSELTDVRYDARGNITYKSDVGTYSYGDTARPARLTGITPVTQSGATAVTGVRTLKYAWDDANTGAKSVNGTTFGNGNLWYTVTNNARSGQNTIRWETYTSFNQPSQIMFADTGTVTNPTPSSSSASRTVSFVYGPEHQRIKQSIQLSGTQPYPLIAGDTWYMNGDDGQSLSFEYELRTDGAVESRHYLSGAGIVFGVYISRTGTLGTLPASEIRYFHHDQLGSLARVTSGTGAYLEFMRFDPWGKRVTITGNSDLEDSEMGVNSDRGFTMHEHIDEVGAINMNGRVYDPRIGRFFSADPFVQNPMELQSYNRYSYVMNNPLSMTDPSGYFSVKKLLRTAVAIVIAYYTGQWVGGWATSALMTTATACTPALAATGSMMAGAAGGFVGGVIAGGNLQSGVNGALTGGLFGLAGTVAPGNPEEFTRYAAHAAAGCISSAAGGGKCGGGAASAVFGKFTTNQMRGITDDLTRGVATSIAGGIGSVIAGGKFENGATTAAFGYLFNELLHQTSKIQQGYADKSTMYRYHNGWIDAAGNPTVNDAAAERQAIIGLTDVGGMVVSVGTAACIAFTPCAGGAVTGGVIVGTGLSIANSAAQASPSSTLIDFLIDSAAALVPNRLRFVSQIGAEVVKKTDTVDNVKKSADSYVKP